VSTHFEIAKNKVCSIYMAWIYWLLHLPFTISCIALVLFTNPFLIKISYMHK